jgi:hypothetical protein
MDPSELKKQLADLELELDRNPVADFAHPWHPSSCNSRCR